MATRLNNDPWRSVARLFLLVALLTVGLHLLADSEALASSSTRLFRIGTGGLTGVYYPIGKLIAQGLTGMDSGADAQTEGEAGIPGLIGVAQNSAGSVDNARAVLRGEIEAGLVQADVAWQAYQGQQAFAGVPGSHHLRAVASLYAEKLQIVTRRDAHIRSIHDFRGKRISIDEIGSGTLAVMRTVLAAYQLTESDFSPVYLKPVFTQGKMKNGELHGFVMMAGTPMEAVTGLNDIGLMLVPIEPAIAADIHQRHPYLVPGTIPGGTYDNIPETPTLQVHALLVVRETLDKELVRQLTACLWSDRTKRLLFDGHPQGREITLDSALNGLSIPLHHGAERFYRDHRILK